MHRRIILSPMSRLASHLKARPRLIIAVIVGIAVALLVPSTPRWITRALLGWNAAVWLYIVLIVTMMLRADPSRLRRVAALQAQGAAVVLGVVVTASVASLAAIGVELAAIKAPGGAMAWPHLLFAASTVVGSWVLLPVMFSLNYASLYHHHPLEPGGLDFPGAGPGYHADFLDFLYFSFTIAVASQTADVAISTKPIRRLVLLQSLLSFGFNAAILALTINIAASLF
ncbi:MAG: DUF1345 domain-containing protein [Burkholderiales bacterium]|nr:DUF1345 domain-containing protein [Burkholderiales bacterium]MDE2398498.1 DUF1345 domain-containing protein [Burkholderiales bacterium]MDE2457502.1 DUF1345 domain-containing protein [Burkholderiales bacterium]